VVSMNTTPVQVQHTMASPSLAVVAMCLIAFLSNMTISMLAPFLPQHIRNLDLDERWSGIVFSFYPIAVIVTTPVANTLVARHGRLLLIGLGLQVQAISAVVFGLMGDSLAIMLLSRFLQGCGASASNLGIFALIADLFEDSLGQVMGLNELSIGAGFSLGPLIGSLLFDLGGFSMPFIICGALLTSLAAMMPVLCGLSEGATTTDQIVNESTSAGSGSALERLWRICTYRLLAPAGLMLFGTVVWGVIDSGFYTVHSQHDLRLDQTAVGINLAAASGAYALLGPCVGCIADKIGYGVTMTAGGSISAGALLLLGPVGKPACAALGQALQIGDVGDGLRRWWEFTILVVLGCGQAGMLIPSLGAMKSTVPPGDTSSTEACICLFNSFQQAGSVLGPWLSSALGTKFNLGSGFIAASIFTYCGLFGKQLCLTRILSKRTPKVSLYEPLSNSEIC